MNLNSTKYLFSNIIPLENIRSFCIIAHIVFIINKIINKIHLFKDHGKSTLADRFLEITGSIDPKVDIYI